MKRVLVCSKNEFPDFVEENLGKSIAYISIENIGDSHYLEEGSNVLNIEFNDTSEEDGGSITEEKAVRLLEFIESHLDYDFVIHCNAGVSRSQAVYKFIKDFYKEYSDCISNKNKPCVTPNSLVFIKLKESYYNKHGYPFENNRELFMKDIKRDAGKFIIFEGSDRVHKLIGLLVDLEDYYWITVTSSGIIRYTTGCNKYKITNDSFEISTSDKNLRKCLELDLDYWELLESNQDPEVELLYSEI